MLKTTNNSENVLATYPNKTKPNCLNPAFLLNLYGKVSEMGGHKIRN
jgi:hypothetical protein